jgi:hypothetical protein
MISKTYQQFERELDEKVGSLLANARSIGESIQRASTLLSNDDYKRLIKHLAGRGLTESMLRLCVKVAENTVPEKLVFCGVPPSKLVDLNERDLQRLASDDPIQFRRPNGDIENKPFSAMTEVERNQILSPKGHRILTINEQESTVGKPRRIKTTYERVHYDEYNQELIGQVGTKEGVLTVSSLASMSPAEFEKLVQNVRDASRLREAGVA